MKKTKKKGNSNSYFPKTERLKSKKKIQELFSGSSSFFLYPIRTLFLYPDINVPKEEPISRTYHSGIIHFPEILISIPKRNSKKAVDRNRLKRQIKEAYRLNKTLLSESKKMPSQIVFIYISKKKESYKYISDCIINLLKRF